MTTPVTGRHAAPDTSPGTEKPTERRSDYYPIFVTQPLSTFFGNADNMARLDKARKKLGAVVRDICGVDVSVGLMRPFRQMHDDDKTNTFNAAELGIKFTNITRRELEDYTERLTNALTGKNRIKLLDGPDYDDLVAEPIVEFPDQERIQESISAGQHLSRIAAERESNGGTLAKQERVDTSSSETESADPDTTTSSRFDGASEDDLI